MPRTTLSAGVRALAAVVLLVAAPVASAASTLVFTGDAGDWISRGQTWSFTDPIDALASSDLRTVRIDVNQATWWSLAFQAPAGTQLVPGIYEGATRHPFNDDGTGLSLSGDGRGCNTLTGRFEVHEAVYGPQGYVVKFRASFEQHCEGGTTAAWGEVSIDNPPPPPAMTMSVQFDSKMPVQRKTGRVTVSGSVTCSAQTSAYVTGVLAERVSRTAVASAGFGTPTACGPTPTRFAIAVSSTSGVPFAAGQAQIDATGRAPDPNYGGDVVENVSTVVALQGVR